mgnify:CR=1 FL=1
MSVVLQERVDIKENILFELDKDLLNKKIQSYENMSVEELEAKLAALG